MHKNSPTPSGSFLLSRRR
jgi:hypothetical protein